MTRRLLVAALTGVIVLGSGVVPAAADSRADYEASLGTPPDELRPRALLGHPWRGTGTMVSGAAVVSRGELVVDDRPFDDTGADSQPGNGAVLQDGVEAATLSGLCSGASGYQTGDLAYPSGPEHLENAADLVQVRVAVTGGRVHVLWQLQTLLAPGTTAVALLVDADGVATGGSTGFPGFEHLLVATADGATLDGAAVPSAIDLVGNTIESSFPRAALPQSTWRVNAVAALRSASGLGALADAGFVADEPVESAQGCRLDTVQSAQLQSRVLDGVTVDVSRLVGGASDPVPLRRGAFTRSYVPRLELGEGLAPQPRYEQSSSAQVWRGTVQPYSVYVPQSYDPGRANPVILLLHCLLCHHTVFDMASFPGLARLAESRVAVVVTPFGYGEGGWYEGEAEADAFEVLSDVSRRYRVDPSRLYLSGMSMGSTGTYRLGLMHPDLWAALLPVASATKPQCVAVRPEAAGCVRPFDYVTVFPNARNLPVGVVQGTADELTPVSSGRRYAELLASDGTEHRYWEFARRTHDPALHGLTSALTDPWLANRRAVRSPATVTYVSDVPMWGAGERYDRAYWLTDMRISTGVTRARVDATSGRGTGLRTAPTTGSGSDDAAGPWTMQGLDATPVAPTGRNELSVVSTGYGEMVVDVVRSRLDRVTPLTVEVTTDVPLRLRLGSTVVAAAAGTSRVVLPPSRDDRETVVPTVSSAEVTPTATLPTTGGTPPWAALLVLLGCAALLRRRMA